MSLRSPARFLAPAERLVRDWQVDRDPAFADRVADAWIKAQAYRLHTFGTVTRLAGGGELGAESSVTKVFWSDLDVAMHQTALDLRGPDGELAGAWTDGCCSRSAARSTRAPTRFSAISSPSGCWACPGSQAEMRFDLDEQQRDFAASIDAALGAADLPAAVRAWAGRRHRAGPQGVGDAGRPRRHGADRAGESSTASRPTRSIWWSPANGWATGVCRVRSPNPSRWRRSCLPTTSAAPHWPPANSSPPSRCHRTCRGRSTPTPPG